MKYRVVETTEGNYYPQCKPGFFSFWKFFSKQAESNIDSGWMLRQSILTDVPANAVYFGTAEEAHGFTVRIEEKSQKYWSDDAKKAGVTQNINFKKVHKSR